MTVLSREDATCVAAAARKQGRRVVFTNGVFDLLIVGINSDRSVRRNKGPERPITPEGERAEILAALDCVDAVTVFDEETPHEIISALQPDVLVKGADWAHDAIVGRDVVESRGGRVVRVAVEQGYSTTALVTRIREIGRT